MTTRSVESCSYLIRYRISFLSCDSLFGRFGFEGSSLQSEDEVLFSMILGGLYS